mgnify:FL=1
MIEYYSKENAITAFKAFNEDFTCRSFQYEVGKSYHMSAEIIICKRGFHACKNPLDIFEYYPIFNSKIAIVKLWGVVDLQLGLDNFNIDAYNGKLCASNIYIEKELNYTDLIQYFMNFAKTQGCESDFLMGSCCNLISNKKYISNRRSESRIFLNRHRIQCTSIGNSNNIQINSNSSTLILTGFYNNIYITGNRVKVLSNFNNNKIIINGSSPRIYSQGANTDITVFGDEPRIHNKGNYSRITCFGHNPCIKANKGSCIIISDERYRTAKVVYIDGDTIKEDTWYTYCNGKPIEGICQIDQVD